jgi:hypothetical protein
MMPNLVYLIEQYEHHLKQLNKHFQNKFDFTENFEICLRDFKILLPLTETNSQLESIANSDDDSNDTRMNNSMGNQQEEDDENSNDRQTTTTNQNESDQEEDEEIIDDDEEDD